MNDPCEGPLAARVRATAAASGFDRVAFAGPEVLTEDADRLARWARQGKAASMSWMVRDSDRRAAPKWFLPQVRSVVVLGVSYGGEPCPPAPGPAYGRVARYAWGQDYHSAVEERLKRFEDGLRKEMGDVVVRASVDAQPFLERAFARRAGMGFVGKNTNVIVPGAGSFLFLAALAVDVDLPSGLEIVAGCGGCVRCMDRCPTKALETPYSLDARLCVAYHTIENRGPIPASLREGVGDWLFGCDDCQDVCPFNVRPLAERWPEFSAERGVGAWVPLAEVLRLRTPGDFKKKFHGSPLARAKRSGLVRNACVVARNRGAVDELKADLSDVAENDPDPMVREAAAWALS